MRSFDNVKSAGLPTDFLNSLSGNSSVSAPALIKYVTMADPSDFQADIYAELLGAISSGDEESVVRLVASGVNTPLTPDSLFGILLRIGARNYSYETFTHHVPHSLFALNSAHTLAQRLPRKDAFLILAQAGVYLAHDWVKFENNPVEPVLAFEENEPEFLGEILLRAIETRDLPRADGALEKLLKLPNFYESLANYLFLACSLDRKNIGHKLIMATNLLESAEKLKFEIGFGILRPAVHYASCEVISEQRKRVEEWIAEIDLEDSTLFSHKRELDYKEAVRLADVLLNTEDCVSAVNHTLRNECSLKSFLDVLTVCACEWIYQRVNHFIVAIHRLTYVHSARMALERMTLFPLYPVLQGVELLRDGWEGRVLQDAGLSIEVPDTKEALLWASSQDFEPTAGHVSKFIYAFLGEDRALAPELKPYLYRAYHTLREQIEDAGIVRERFYSAEWGHE